MQPENFITSEADALSGTEFPDEREPGFKRTMVMIVAAHIALISLIAYFEDKKTQPPASVEQITWMDADSLMAAAAAPLPELTIEPEPVVETEPEVQPEPPSPPDPAPEPVPEPETAPVPEPKPKPEHDPEPEIALKPKPKPEPVKPKVESKPDKPKPDKPKPVTKPFISGHKPEPKPKKPETKPKQNASTTNKKPDEPKPVQPKPTLVAAATNPTANGTGKESPTQTSGGNAGGDAKPGGLTQSELSTYFRSVGERFKTVWNEPVSVIGTGHNLVAYVRIRVKADGTVESAILNGSSGNREMDDSIEAAFPSFKNVPPPPAALLKSNGCMEETMEVKLGL